MRWIALNVFGAFAFLSGLSLSKGASLPSPETIVTGDHQFLVGMMCGIVGLAVMLWGNFRSPA